MAHLHVQPFALTRDAVGVAGLLEEGAIARAEGGVRADERLEVLLPLGSREERPLAPAVLEVGANARRLIKPEVALVVQLDARHFGGWHVRGCSSSFSVAVPVLIAWSLAATAIVTVMAATAGVVAAAVVGVAAVVAAGAVGAAAAVGVAAATVGVATAVVAAAAMGATVGVPSVIIATLVVALRIPAVATVSLVITLTLALGHVIQGHRKASWLLALLRHIFLAAPTFVLLLGSTTAPRARELCSTRHFFLAHVARAKFFIFTARSFGIHTLQQEQQPRKSCGHPMRGARLRAEMRFCAASSGYSLESERESDRAQCMAQWPTGTTSATGYTPSSFTEGQTRIRIRATP